MVRRLNTKKDSEKRKANKCAVAERTCIHRQYIHTHTYIHIYKHTITDLKKLTRNDRNDVGTPTSLADWLVSAANFGVVRHAILLTGMLVLLSSTTTVL